MLLKTMRQIGIVALSLLAFNTMADDKVQVLMSTSAGDITLELDRAKAPISVDNFLNYVNSKHYDGTVFHRVINNFMVQGGGFDINMRQKSTQMPIKNEAKNGLKNTRGTIAMARTSNIDSATSQFFINLVDNHFLDHGTRDFGYAVFGKVVKGMEVVDAIGMVATNNRDEPRSPIVIRSVSVVEAQAPATEAAAATSEQAK